MFDATNLVITKKGTLSYIMKIKSRFTFKRGVLLDLKISDFGWKMGLFLAQNPRKGGLSKLGYKRGIRFGREWGAGSKSRESYTKHRQSIYSFVQYTI